VNTRNTGRPAGTLEAGGVLDRIIVAKAARLSEAKQAVPLERMIAESEMFARISARRSLAENLLAANRINVIAEIKRRSPSKGIIREDFNPVELARDYEEGGAAALSILAEEDFFGGSLDHLKQARPQSSAPILRKDFIFDEYQLYESVAAGADAILLIVAALDDELLGRLLSLARKLRLDALVETHNQEEMLRASNAGARIIGVNNRNLSNFEVDLETSFRLSDIAPPDCILVSESGISSPDHIRRLKSAGYNGFLIGEHFMRAERPGFALRELIAAASD
jgi:indole-3-glycerol phosphate synthase